MSYAATQSEVYLIHQKLLKRMASKWSTSVQLDKREARGYWKLLRMLGFQESSKSYMKWRLRKGKTFVTFSEQTNNKIHILIRRIK